MTKPKPRPKRAVDAVRDALAREAAKRPDGLKPIEIVKTAICAYQAYTNEGIPKDAAGFESPDKSGLRRGTQVSVDRLLFNANYWLAAYEERIVATCEPDDAAALIKAVTVWSTHTLKLNTLSAEAAIATFERFCPPFATNNRRGSSGEKGSGKGPVVEFAELVGAIAARTSDDNPTPARKRPSALTALADEMKAEARAYDELPAASALDALFSILPAWCLQDRIPLVSGSWWDDADVMELLAAELKAHFVEMGFGEAPCQYFQDSLLEAVDAYHRDLSSNASPLAELPIPELIDLVHNAREAHPEFEADGYGSALPAWLSAKEQLVWNTLVCALYGPGSARPLLVATPSLLPSKSADGNPRSDVITDLAKTSFARYSADRAQSNADRQYATFFDQPDDLRNSSIEHIKSIPGKLEVLGYEIVPDGSCYPDQKVSSLSPSEIECLAVLEHRRWIAERTKAGWTYAAERDVDAKTSPYLVAWEDLPDRAREWNRSAIRNIPALLASENLAIARK